MAGRRLENGRARAVTAALLCMLMLGALAQPAAARAPANEYWASTWQASPEKSRAPAVNLNNQTIRQIVRVSLGGQTIRVRLTNEFSERPVTIGAAHVALAGAGSAIQPATDQVMTFGGNRQVVIPAGAYVLSDPIDMPVPSLSALAVSLFLPKETGALTEHFFALQTAYVAPRDVTGAASMPGATTIAKRALVSGVDVATTRKTKVVVALGDSITGGFGSTLDSNRRWPDMLAARLIAKKMPVAVVNAGIGGNRLLHDFIGANALARFDADVLSQAGVTHVVILEGINDFGFPGGRNLPDEEVTATDVIVAYRQLIVRAHSKGVKVIAATLLPFGAIPERPGYYSEGSAAKREAVNQWMRNTKEFDGLIDFEAAVRDPRNPKAMLPAYDSGDHLNPSDAGYKAMADAIDLKLFQ